MLQSAHVWQCSKMFLLLPNHLQLITDVKYTVVSHEKGEVKANVGFAAANRYSQYTVVYIQSIYYYEDFRKHYILMLNNYNIVRPFNQQQKLFA